MNTQHHNSQTTEYELRLTHAGIRPTALRLLVYKTVYEQMQNAFSLQDVKDCLPHADNSSLFRTLALLDNHHLLHQIDDGSGMQRYCVCRCGQFKCHHVHFTCTQCHETVCLKSLNIPMVDVPDGYLAQDAEFIIKGICPKCQTKNHQH